MIALASALGMAQLQTTHDDPVGGENNSVRLFFLQRTTIVTPQTPANEFWQHTHKGQTFLVVDAGNGKVRNIALSADPEILISFGSGQGYKTARGGARITIADKGGAALALAPHMEVIAEAQRLCSGDTGPAQRALTAMLEGSRSKPPQPPDAMAQHYGTWKQSTCGAAKAAIDKQDLTSAWVTELTGWTFAPPTVKTTTNSQFVYFLGGDSGVRMTRISAGPRAGGWWSRCKRKSVTLDGADCARFVICSHEEVAKTGRPCVLPPHSNNPGCRASYGGHGSKPKP